MDDYGSKEEGQVRPGQQEWEQYPPQRPVIRLRKYTFFSQNIFDLVDNYYSDAVCVCFRLK